MGVMLVNTGTPEEPTPKAVRKYLSRFLSDRRIVPMNPIGWWLILHLFILPKRGKASAAKYRKIWTPEGSPFMIAHEKLCSGLDAQFKSEGLPVVVRHAMSYSNPSMLGVLREFRTLGCSHVVVLPLYPQSAYSTTGSVHDGFDRAMKKLHWDVPFDFVEDYHNNATYVRSIAASIRHAGFSIESDDRLLFSYHSIPLNDIENGDTYELQTGASSVQIASELGIDRRRWTIGYQCRFDKGREWLTPFTADVLTRWAQAGVGRVFFVCPNFAVDCLETLYDIEHELKPFYFEQMKAAGRDPSPGDFVYVPCLDRSKAHVRVLSDVLRPYVSACL